MPMLSGKTDPVQVPVLTLEFHFWRPDKLTSSTLFSIVVGCGKRELTSEVCLMLNSRRTRLVFTVVATTLSMSALSVSAQTANNTGIKAPSPEKVAMNVTGPFKSGNLAVYLIHGQDAAPDQKMITLDEAIKGKKVVVHETGNVNQLTVENRGDVAVFIQSGDIVKGGQQDRTMQHDLILPPKSQKIPVNSFCVESGRWSQRGQESKGSFAGSSNLLAGKSLKIATKSGYASQGDVWREVTKVQNKLKSIADARKLGPVVPAASPTSLQLTLESDGLKKLSDQYVRDIKPIVVGKSDTIGYAFAVNGKISSVDVYSSHDLFSRLWPKLVLSTAQEAATESADGKNTAPPVVEEVKKYIETTEKTGNEKKEDIPGRLVVVRRESEKNLFLETQGKVSGKPKPVWFHKNYIAK